MCIHCGAGEHEDCNCEEHSNEIRAQQEQITRLVSEVERHRMTPEERRGVAWAVKESKNWADEHDDEHDQTHGNRASALAAYLERTEQKEVGRE